jgi:Tfp pilus assembly protein PilV
MNIQKAQQGFGLVKVLISIPLVLIGLVILAFAYTELNKAYWDYRVKELCEKEG